MLPSFLAALLFSASVVAAGRSARLLGSNSANLWRLVAGTALLMLWAHTFGGGLRGDAFSVFFISGCVGFGLGDYALFQTLPRLGPRLSSLLTNCLAAPFAAAIEWVWLGTTLTWFQMVCGGMTLGGVGLALAPERHAPISPNARLAGVLFGALAGFGQGFGAVLSRKAYAVAAAAGQQIDGGTAAYQRILGGLLVVALPLCWLWLAEQFAAKSAGRLPLSPSDRSAAWRWVLVNALAGPTLGVACFQWALKTTPSGIVLPIVATTPLVIIPFTYFMEGDRPGKRSLAGGVLAVVGVIALTLSR